MENKGGLWQFWIGILALTLLVLAYYICTWRSFASFQYAMDQCAGLFCDFADYYYPMGETILRAERPVSGFVYSPFIAILLAAFPPLGLNTSLVLWGVLQATFIVLYLLLFRWLIPARPPYQLLFVALTLSSFPLLHNLSWGQVGVFMTVALLGALFFYDHSHPAVAAALLAFGISFKYFPIIFLLPFVVRRDLRFLLMAAAACGLFLFVVPGIVLGADDMLRFYETLLTSYRRFDWVINSYNSQFLPHVLVRLLKAAGYAQPLLRLAESGGYNPYVYLSILRWIAYSIAAVNAGFVLLVQRARLPHANLWSFHILFLTVPFVHNTSWPVDLVYLSFAQALMAWTLLQARDLLPAAAVMSQTSRIVAVLLLGASILFSNIVFFNIIGNRSRYGSTGFVLWADLCLLAASYLVLLPAAWRTLHKSSGRRCTARALAGGGSTFVRAKSSGAELTSFPSLAGSKR